MALWKPIISALQVQVVPQRPVSAPGCTLLEQVIYPLPLPECTDDVDTQQLAHALQQVGLSELLQRVQGDWTLSQDWQGGGSGTCGFFVWHECNRLCAK